MRDWRKPDSAVKNSILGGRGSPNKSTRRRLKVTARRVMEVKIIHVQREGPVGILPNELLRCERASICSRKSM